MSVILEFFPYDSKYITDIGYFVVGTREIIYSVFKKYCLNNYVLIGIYTLILCNLIWEIFNYYFIVKSKKVCRATDNNATDDDDIMGLNDVFIPKELYYQSILEVLAKNNEIASKMTTYTDYWVLLRVVLKKPMKMKRSKYELHGNNVGDSRKNIFGTQDMYMIIKLCFNEYEYINNCNGKINFNMANIIVRCMNQLNKISPDEFKTNDFIVVAISTKPIINNYHNEFYEGLINNNYELYNFKNMKIKITNKNNKSHYINYIMMLPIHEIYDIFMDVYNNTIFESAKYVIDNDNYESWNGVSINNLKF